MNKIDSVLRITLTQSPQQSQITEDKSDDEDIEISTH